MVEISELLIKEFHLKPFQVNNTIKLIDEGNTIPFIARYRKEITGELDDNVLRDFYERLLYLRNLEERRSTVGRLVEEQGKLTPELLKGLQQAVTLHEIEDIYRPFRPKRKTRASVAKAKGLEPLAEILMEQDPTLKDLEQIIKTFIHEEKGIERIEDALSGAMDIIGERVSDHPLLRKKIREIILKEGRLVVTAKTKEDSVYRMYYDYTEPLSKIPPHRILAINRGEKENVLGVKVEGMDEKNLEILWRHILKPHQSITKNNVEEAVRDSYHRLIFPSVEREIRNSLTEMAEEKAMKVFAENLKNLLLQPPIKGNVVLGLDPAYRTGCKLAVVDDTGKVLATEIIYPTPPQSKVEEAKSSVKRLIEKFEVELIAIGNGTASKESEIFIAEIIKELDQKVYYMVVNEAGASVYSASKLGAQEFPNFDVAQRSAVSIARRLQDPLAELVKIDPKSIGIGQYQHDMNQKKLGESLGRVVEHCVNTVGVDLNTASASLLSYISGINSIIAKNIVEFRDTNGKFKKRKDLLKVKKLGEKAFLQCAGFLRIPDGENVLDNTSVHPEVYEETKQLIEILGYNIQDVKHKKIDHLQDQIDNIGMEELAKKLEIGIPTLRDILGELSKPGRDPRDELPKPVLLSDVMHLEDLKSGMVLTGIIRNVADFGAFVDVGVHQDGLVHISQLKDGYVKRPMDVVALGDIVKVKVLEVDGTKKRISLSMRGVNQTVF
jgi:protein Tex